MNKFDDEEFKRLKSSVESEYKKIVSIYSPALKAKIFFNAKGLYHLRYGTNHHERNRLVQQSKFRFLNSAVEVIKISTTIQEYRRDMCHVGKANKNGSRQFSLVEWFAFFSVVSFVKQTRVKAIVRRVGGENGHFHFWSVMPFWSLHNNKRLLGLKEIEDQ